MKKFIIIKTENQGYFISDNIEGKSYFSSEISKLKFDSQFLEIGKKEGWYKINDIPKTVEEKLKDVYINKRYELKQGYPETTLIPKVILAENFDSEDEIAGLYSYKHDIVEGQWISVDFEYEILEVGKVFEGKPKYSYSSTILSQLTTHSGLQTESPCYISGSEFYNIIRKYIKTNIDGRYAQITSDYDFCLTVQKVLELHAPEKYTINRGTEKRPKYETRYNTSKKVTVFSSAPKAYSGYPIQEGISAANYEELEQKIDDYLKELITEINKPLKECPHCKGTGAILTDEEVK